MVLINGHMITKNLVHIAQKMSKFWNNFNDGENAMNKENKSTHKIAQNKLNKFILHLD